MGLSKLPRKFFGLSGKSLSLFVFLWLIALVVFLAWFFSDVPIVSPLTTSSTFRFLRGTKSSEGKVVYGFLPYWNLKKVSPQPELTHLSYFGLTIGAGGELLTRTSEGGEPGYYKLDSDELASISAALKDNKQKLELTLIQFNADDIYAFINSKKSQEEFYTSVESVLLSYPFSGINIDIEYGGTVDEKLRTNFSQFIVDLKERLSEKYSHINLSVSVYASAAQGNSIWDIGPIGEAADYVVVMAYDFHRRSSVKAGPVAPLFGGKDLWDGDISNYLQSFIAVMPKEKILLGVPFYGYEWQTTSRDPRAHTFPDTGATASYERVQTLLEPETKEKLRVEESWNEDALSPYVSYIEDGEIFVVYYENSRSLSYKLDLVNQLDLGGIAIWALGYEGDSRELWETIGRKL
ncbi:MAG: glycosyl hydrolase family 18 protein [Candidatus Pacebacteria bacterium]|nr:glycosyl hydrolase family 18 protein [Candidatus Paceibacterota bacterium]